MDDERLSNLAQRVREDNWPVAVAGPAEVRRRSDRRQRRRTTAVAFGAAVAVPAAIGLLTSLTTPAGPPADDPPATRITASASAGVPTPPPTTDAGPVTATASPATPAVTSSPTLKNAAPADLALAKSLLATDELPKDFIALPSCCHYDMPISPPADETTCDARRREWPANKDGRTAQAMLPIRYTGAVPALTEVSLLQQLNSYASPAAAVKAMARHRQTLELCRSGRDTMDDASFTATWRIGRVVDAELGDDSVLWVTPSEVLAPTKSTHIRYEILTRSGATLQLMSLSRTVTDTPTVKTNESADLASLEDFARRGLAKLASPAPS